MGNRNIVWISFLGFSSGIQMRLPWTKMYSCSRKLFDGNLLWFFSHRNRFIIKYCRDTFITNRSIHCTAELGGPYVSYDLLNVSLQWFWAISISCAQRQHHFRMSLHLQCKWCMLLMLLCIMYKFVTFGHSGYILIVSVSGLDRVCRWPCRAMTL